MQHLEVIVESIGSPGSNTELPWVLELFVVRVTLSEVFLYGLSTKRRVHAVVWRRRNIDMKCAILYPGCVPETYERGFAVHLPFLLRHLGLRDTGLVEALFGSFYTTGVHSIIRLIKLALAA